MIRRYDILQDYDANRSVSIQRNNLTKPKQYNLNHKRLKWLYNALQNAFAKKEAMVTDYRYINKAKTQWLHSWVVPTSI